MRFLVVLVVGAAMLAGGFAVFMAQSTTANDPEVDAASYDTFDVLVFSRTNGWRHDNANPANGNAAITAGKAMIQELGATNNFNVTISEDNTIMSDEGLAPFEVVVFLNTTSSNGAGICPYGGYDAPGVYASGSLCGDLLTAGQQTAFENWYKAGNGWVGTHSASDTEKPSDAAGNGGSAWPWYGGLLGNNAWFTAHGGANDSACVVKNPAEADHISASNPAVDGTTSWALPSEWSPVQDEWYSFTNNPTNNITPTVDVPHTPVNVVLTRPWTSNTATNTNCATATYPVAWYHEYDGGRAFYTARGHGRNDWREHFENAPNPPGINSHMRNHILGGILYAANVTATPDEQAPVSVATLDPASPNGIDDWYISDPTLTMTATDDIAAEGSITKEYRINGGDWMTYTAPVAITQQGDVTIDYRSTDPAGNVEVTRSLEDFKLDSELPDTSASALVNEVTLTPTDATSGIASTQYCIGESCTPNIDYTEPFSPDTIDQHIIRYRSTDMAGNQEAIKQITLNIEKSNQFINIDVPLPSVMFGSSDITINAQASPSGLPVAMAASGACASAGNVVSLTSVGTCVIDFEQAGDDLWNPTTLSRDFEVEQAGTSTSLSTKRKVKKGKKIRLKATVQTGMSAVSAQIGQGGARVEFYVGNKRVGSATLNNNNVSSLKVRAKRNWGRNAKITAVYTGNDLFHSSSSSNSNVRVNN